MESLALLTGKEIIINNVEFNLGLTSKVILSIFVFKWLNTELPVKITQKQIAEDLGLEYKVVGKTIRELVDSGILIARKSKGPNETGPLSWYYYGHKEIFVDGSVIPENFVAPQESLVSNKRSYSDFYVYVCTHKDVPVYVGKGSGKRLEHCLSGKSTSAELNRLVFSGELENMKVTKMYSGLTDKEALKREREIIEGFKLLGYNLTNRQ